MGVVNGENRRESINQSIEQTINRSINQSSKQSINQSIIRPINQSINRSTEGAISQLVNQSNNQRCRWMTQRHFDNLLSEWKGMWSWACASLFWVWSSFSADCVCFIVHGEFDEWWRIVYTRCGRRGIEEGHVREDRLTPLFPLFCVPCEKFCRSTNDGFWCLSVTSEVVMVGLVGPSAVTLIDCLPSFNFKNLLLIISTFNFTSQCSSAQNFNKNPQTNNIYHYYFIQGLHAIFHPHVQGKIFINKTSSWSTYTFMDKYSLNITGCH